MLIAVLIKEVPDTETRFKIEGGKIDYSGVKFVINPYDEYAYEEAVRIKERLGEDQVKVVAILAGSREESAKNLLNVLAVGVDEAIHILDPALEGLDPLGAAKVLKVVLDELKPDLILAGKQGVDYDYGQTPAVLAGMMNLPYCGPIAKLELEDGAAVVERHSEVGVEVHRLPLPCILSCDKALNEPRYPNLKGIMGAKKKPQHRKTLADLGIDPQTVGTQGSQIDYLSFAPPPERKPGVIIEGQSVEEKVEKLVRLLHEEAKVI